MINKMLKTAEILKIFPIKAEMIRKTIQTIDKTDIIVKLKENDKLRVLATIIANRAIKLYLKFAS